jgi:hypothetical protein
MNAGQSPVPRNSLETIRKMIQDGELPSGETCPYSSRPADDQISVHVECERSWIRGGNIGSGQAMVYWLLFGWIGWLILRGKSRPREEFGRDTSIIVPLRISSDVRSQLLRLRGQKKWKAILRHVPVYAKLLEDYPRAEISPLRATEQSGEREPPITRVVKS